MGTRAGKDCLRSKEFWEGLLGEYGAKRMLMSLSALPRHVPSRRCRCRLGCSSVSLPTS